MPLSTISLSRKYSPHTNLWQCCFVETLTTFSRSCHIFISFSHSLLAVKITIVIHSNVPTITNNYTTTFSSECCEEHLIKPIRIYDQSVILKNLDSSARETHAEIRQRCRRARRAGRCGNGEASRAEVVLSESSLVASNTSDPTCARWTSPD